MVFPLCAKDKLDVTTQVDKTQIRVGDPVQFDILLEKKDDIRIVIADSDINLAPFDVLDIDRSIEEYDSKIIEKISLKISIYETGEFSIPAIEIPYVTQDATQEKAITKPVTISVQSVLNEDDQQLRELKAPIQVQPRMIYLAGIIGFVISLVATIVFLIWWWKRFKCRKKSMLSEEVQPKLPADEIALAAISNLKNQNYLGQGELKIFYVKATEIFKHYLQDRYAIPVIERTTGEIKSDIKHTRLTHKDQHIIASILEAADIVKFAKYRPSIEQASEFLNKIEKFILDTRENEFQKSHNPDNETVMVK